MSPRGTRVVPMSLLLVSGMTAACSAADGSTPTTVVEPEAVDAAPGAEDVPSSDRGAEPGTGSSGADVASPDATVVAATRSGPAKRTGNRWLFADPDSVPLAVGLTTDEPRVVDVDGTVRWVLALDSPLGETDVPEWVVVLDDGRALRVGGDGETVSIGALTAGVQPEVVAIDDRLAVRPASTVATARFADALPDAEPAVTPLGWVAVPTAPTDRYPHGALGDRIEAGSLRIESSGGDAVVIDAVEPGVFEMRTPLWADVDGDGADDVVVTRSDPSGGARIVAYATDGSVVGESSPIGSGNRWRHLIAVAPMTPDGVPEVIDVSTPHLGGPLEFMRLDGEGRFEVVAGIEGFTSHVNGSANLDMAVVFDADADGAPEVVLPTRDRTALGVIGRDGDTATVDATVDLPGELTANLAVRPSGAGWWVATGVDDQLVVWAPS